MAATKPKLVSTMPKVLETVEELKALISATPSDKKLHAFFSARLSKELLINQPAEYQRRQDRGYIALYRRAMAATPSRWRHYQPDNVMMFDTKCQMMSGQHRCLAAVEANAVFGAWIIGNLPGIEVKYLDQVRARTVGQTIEMFGHHNASSIASVAKMFLFWTIGESPLVPGRISPDEANEILQAYPEIQDWYLQARRVKDNHRNSTPSVPWLTYILGRMAIEDAERGQQFADAMESIQDGRDYTKMVRVLHAHWNSRTARNSLAMKVWYHNTAARAWGVIRDGRSAGKADLSKGPAARLGLAKDSRMTPLPNIAGLPLVLRCGPALRHFAPGLITAFPPEIGPVGLRARPVLFWRGDSMSLTCPKCGYEGMMSHARNSAIVEDYQLTGSVTDTARNLGVSRQYISQFLKANGIKIRPNRQFNAKRALITDTNVASLYHQGLANIEIARSTGLTPQTVRRSLKRQGLLKHSSPLIRSERVRHAIQLFDEGHSASLIADKCGYKNEASARTMLWRHNRHFQAGEA